MGSKCDRLIRAKGIGLLLDVERSVAGKDDEEASSKRQSDLIKGSLQIYTFQCKTGGLGPGDPQICSLERKSRVHRHSQTSRGLI